MKILTLNCHSLIEANYQEKLQMTAKAIIDLQPDIIALQEVNQTMTAAEVKPSKYYSSPHTIKADHHCYNLTKLLAEAGLNYYWCYTPCHIGYDKYDEGVALLSKYPMEQVEEILFSHSCAYDYFQTRKAVAAHLKVGETKVLAVSTHMGWWQRDGESFPDQWDQLTAAIKAMKKPGERVFIMGDFNAPAQVKNEGYDYVLNSGYYDTYNLANQVDDGYTASSVIDGWNSTTVEKIRIDFVMVNEKIEVKKSQVIFNDKNYPVVSDHYGVLVEV